MPKLFSAFTSEVFRPLVTFHLPRAIALSTWFVGLLWQFPELRKMAFDNHAEAGLTLVLAMTFAGMALEDLGMVAQGRSCHSATLEWMERSFVENCFAAVRICFR
jgi:hypothetical protein